MNDCNVWIRFYFKWIDYFDIWIFKSGVEFVEIGGIKWEIF